MLFRSIRELKVEVWTGPNGPPRPHAFKQPAAQAGDGPRQVHAVAYRDGVGNVEVPLPAIGPGQVCWVQPVLTTAKGVHWGPAQATPPDLAPLERRPANLKVSLTAQKERTTRMNSDVTVALQFGKKKTVLVEATRAELLEVLLLEQKAGRNVARIRTAYADLDINVNKDGRNVVIPDHQRGLGVVRTMPPIFMIDEANATASYVTVSLDRKSVV